MKVIAYYLPQFHEVKENNEWWGNGFTEWTNVKKAKQLYKGHNQPNIPENSNYYNLLDKKTVEWQTRLMNDYGIEGMCYYHYWFEGRKILEKPVENLLQWKDINQKFCFCWANHDWRKTWNGTMEMLIKQTYGLEEEWERHFEYLYNFFKDERYIKIDEKPIFVIYSARDIPNFNQRIKFYQKKAVEKGFKGIYIIETISFEEYQVVSEETSGIVLKEPALTIRSLPFFKQLKFRINRNLKEKYIYSPAVFKAKDIYEKSLEILSSYKSNKKIFAGGFNKWDSTVRHGKRGYVIDNKNRIDFENYLKKQKKIMHEKNIEYLFFNAWNEWAEGMYLEPDEKNGREYLEIIKKIVEKELEGEMV